MNIKLSKTPKTFYEKPYEYAYFFEKDGANGEIFPLKRESPVSPHF